MKEFEILMSTGMTKHDAEKHLKQGAYIYELTDYLKNFDEYTYWLDLDDESDLDYRNKLKAFLEKGQTGHFVKGESDLTEYEGVKYFIEYCL